MKFRNHSHHVFQTMDFGTVWFFRKFFMAKAIHDLPHRGSIFPLHKSNCHWELRKKSKKDGRASADPGVMNKLVDSANMCAHSVAPTLKLGSALTMSFSSWILETEPASYFSVTMQRYPSRISACSISISDSSRREKKTYILFGISMRLWSIH